jgi:transcriptional regulator with PAS, ATPase and Fis domain
MQPLESMIKHHIMEIYKETGKNKMQTAKILEIGINTLRRKLRSYGEE